MLTFFPYSVQGDATYTVKGVQALLNGDGEQQCYIEHPFAFQTELETPFCSLNGGGITVPKDQPIRLDGSLSQDPNFYYLEAMHETFAFAWFMNGVE